MCEAQAAANTRMSDVSGICAAPLCLTMQQYAAVGPSVRGAGAQGTTFFKKGGKDGEKTEMTH